MLINAAFILLVLTRTSLTPVFVTFLFNCFAAMIWNFGDFMVFPTADRFWFYFSPVGTGIIPAMMFHFVNALVGLTNHRGWITAAYGLGLPLALSSPLALVHPNIRFFVDSPVWNVYFLMLLLPFFAAGIVMLVKAIRNPKSNGEASRLRYILIVDALSTTNQNRTQAAKKLGISRRTLQNKNKEYDL